MFKINFKPFKAILDHVFPTFLGQYPTKKKSQKIVHAFCRRGWGGVGVGCQTQGLCRLGSEFFSNAPENIYLHQTK